MLLGLCMGGFTACNSDSDNEKNEPKLPTFEEVAAKYVATDETAALQIVELTPDAHYIVAAQGSQKDTDVRFGTYSILDAGKFLLKGYGNVEVNDHGAGAYTLNVTPTDGSDIQVRTNKRRRVEGGKLTERIMGEWKTVALRVQINREGQTFEKTIKDGEWEAMEKELRAWAQQFADETDANYPNNYVDEMIDEYQYQFVSVLFSRFGTYLVIRDKQSECAWWQWENEAEGLLHFSWNEEDMYDKDESRTTRITFEGERLCFTDHYDGFFNETVTSLCEAVK